MFKFERVSRNQAWVLKGKLKYAYIELVFPIAGKPATTRWAVKEHHSKFTEAEELVLLGEFLNSLNEPDKINKYLVENYNKSDEPKDKDSKEVVDLKADIRWLIAHLPRKVTVTRDYKAEDRYDAILKKVEEKK